MDDSGDRKRSVAINRLKVKAQYIVVAIVVLVSGAISVCAQEDPCLNRTIAASVTTETGQPVKGLVAANFRAKFRGKSVDIVSADDEAGSRRIVIVLDASRSMSERWPIEISVAKGLLTALPAENTFALLTFAKQVEDQVDFTQGREAVSDDLVRLKAKDWTLPKGHLRKTALLDTLVAALDLLRPSRVGDAIYLISDGDDNASLTSFSDVKTLFLASGVRLFSLITVDERVARGVQLEGEMGFPALEELVKTTGGDSIEFTPGLPAASVNFHPRPLPITAEDREIMSLAAHVFAREIFEFYKLQIKLPETPDKRGNWKLDVVDPLSKKNPRLRVVYPHKLATCP